VNIPLDNDEGLNWLSLHDRYDDIGVAFEFHHAGACPLMDPVPPARSDALVLCLNLKGTADIRMGQGVVTIPPRHACFFRSCPSELRMTRRPLEQHGYVLAYFAPGFLKRQLAGLVDRLHPFVQGILAGKRRGTEISPPVPLPGRVLDLVGTLRGPPVHRGAQDIWYPAKAMELCAEFLVVASPDELNLFCSRRKRVALERTERAQALVREHLVETLPLEEIARRVGCSPHHLSRTFSSVTGCTIPQYLRQLRMERAAELLNSGRFNVTETAMEVGYASVSHFIQAFQETHGCPPGAYGQAGDRK
jgi:AraC family transcriptional regulator